MSRTEYPPAELEPLERFWNEISLPPQPRCESLSEVFALVEPQVGPHLLDSRGRAAVHHVTQSIPARHSDFWGLEVRLGDPAPRADLLWEIRQGEHGIPSLAGRHPHDPAPQLDVALRTRSPFWEALSGFAEEWLDTPEWLRRLGNVWLEVDAAMSEEALDARLDRPSMFWGANPRVAGSDRELLAALPGLGERFYGAGLDRTRIEAVSAALPEGGNMFQMGIMGARAGPTVVRLCVNALDGPGMERWLAAIAWPGDRGRLRETLARLAPLCGAVALDIDVLPEGVGPKLGIEVYGPERTLSMDPWQPLFDWMVARGIARPEKIRALAGFPSYRRFRQLGVLLRAPAIGYPVIATNLHHLKLVFVEDAVVEAKAYLGVHRPAVEYPSTRGGEMEGGRSRRPAGAPRARDLGMQAHAASATGSRSDGSVASCRAR